MRPISFPAVLRAVLSFGASLALPGAPAAAQDAPAGSEGSTAAEARKKPDLLVAPVPFSSPSTGAGVAAGGVVFYNPNGGPHQWMTGAGVILTSRGTRALALYHSMSSVDDRFRLTAQVSLADQETSYYGIGDAAGDRGDALSLDDKGLTIKVKALLEVLPHVYFGARYVLATHDAEPDPDENADSLTAPPPADQRDSTMSALGPAFVFDTRDDHSQPRRGVLVNATWLLGRDAIGDSYKHDKLIANASVYRPVAERTVIAAKVAFCSAGGDAPYYDLCLFGSGGDLRGYPSGRYRDRASWALQGELRHGFSSRWGGVVFAGIGGIAPSAGGLLDDGNLLPGGGVGVRYRPFSDNEVQLRVDVAVGRDTRGVYLGIGEAF